MNKKLVVAVVPKQKEVSMERKLKGKGVPIFIGAVMGVLIALILMSTGTARAAVNVQNWAQIIYRSSPNVSTAFMYTSTDSAVLRVLIGPSMRMAKWTKNEVSGELGELVGVNKGDTITVVLEAWNDTQTGGDSTAHHVVIYDTFAFLPFYQGGDTGYLVGPDNGVNSFTYVAGSETYSQINTCAIPAKIAYYDSVAGWVGMNGNPVTLTDPDDVNWIAYDSSREANAATALSNLGRVTGIAWYWTYVYAATADSGATSPYAIKVSFQIKKNDN